MPAGLSERCRCSEQELHRIDGGLGQIRHGRDRSGKPETMFALVDPDSFRLERVAQASNNPLRALLASPGSDDRVLVRPKTTNGVRQTRVHLADAAHRLGDYPIAVRWIGFAQW